MCPSHHTRGYTAVYSNRLTFHRVAFLIWGGAVINLPNFARPLLVEWEARTSHDWLQQLVYDYSQNFRSPVGVFRVHISWAVRHFEGDDVVGTPAVSSLSDIPSATLLTELWISILANLVMVCNINCCYLFKRLLDFHIHYERQIFSATGHNDAYQSKVLGSRSNSQHTCFQYYCLA